MFRLRWIGAIWRARVPSTWALSRRLLSSEATISSKTVENGQSIHIERKMKHHIKTGRITDALQLFEDSRNGGNSWAVDSCFSSLLHMFVQHDQHEAVDKLYEDMKRNASYIGEGAKTTMIKSYCNRGQFKQAIDMLHSISDENRAHHTRHYDHVITSLGRSGLTKQALQLFEEKLQCLDAGNCLVSKISKTDRRLYVDKEMIASLLNPDMKINTENEQSKGDNNRLSPKGPMGKYELSGDASLRSSQTENLHAHDVDGYDYSRMSQKVFQYLGHAGERLPVKLLHVIHSRFNHDPVYHWTWKTCSVSETGTCSNCGNQLTSGILPSDIHQLEGEIVSPQQNVDPAKNIHKELEDYHFQKFVKERGPFDVIIDGMNVGSYGSTSRFKFTEDLVKNTVHHFAAQQKKLLLIIRHQMITEDLHAKLENVCAVFRTKFKNDDLYFLYAAAFSGMQQVEVITNDKLRDHRLLLPTNLWWTFLRWTRLNCVRFKVNDKGELRFFRQKFDPVVQLSGNSWHFPTEDHTWRCVTRFGGRTSLT